MVGIPPIKMVMNGRGMVYDVQMALPKTNIIAWLVVWNIFLFSLILGIIIPIDFPIFQRGRYTTNQIHGLSIDYP